jgi:hypothetical protein
VGATEAEEVKPTNADTASGTAEVRNHAVSCKADDEIEAGAVVAPNVPVVGGDDFETIGAGRESGVAGFATASLDTQSVSCPTSR